MHGWFLPIHLIRWKPLHFCKTRLNTSVFTLLNLLSRISLLVLNPFVNYTFPGCLWFLYLPPANVVCEGYVFTGVCLSTGGNGHPSIPPLPLLGADTPPGPEHPPWSRPPGTRPPPRSRPPPEQNPPGPDPPWSRHPPPGADPPPRWSLCGRYASYCNAFLC